MPSVPLRLLLVVTLLGWSVVAAATTAEQVVEGALLQRYCSACHLLDRALVEVKDREGWQQTVARMSDLRQELYGHHTDAIPVPEQDRIVEALVRRGVAGARP